MFYDILKNAKNDLGNLEASFSVTNKIFYDSWISNNKDFLKFTKNITKEWEVLSKSKNRKFDFKVLNLYQERLGIDPGIFGALICDRRIFMGYKSTFKQDYKRRFDDKTLLTMLQVSLEEVDKLFNSYNPNIVISFQCVTIFDYLFYLFARERKIKYLNLRPSKIENRILFSSTINDPPPEILDEYQINLQNPKLNLDQNNSSIIYLQNFRSKNALYEGVVKPSKKPTQKIDLQFNTIFKITKLMKDIFKYYFYKYYLDNHISNPLVKAFYLGIYNPFNAMKMNRYLSKRYLDKKKLNKIKYVFFPMHTEPEVSLLVYGKPFINQIELIRIISMNLPIDTYLVVKDHPWMIGKRSLKSYKKILNIPKVRIAKPNFTARELIENSSLVMTIASSVSIEAIFLKKPTITFGMCMSNIFPHFMATKCIDIKNLNNLINNYINTKIDNYNDWDKHIYSFLNSIFKNSEKVNLYTNLLQRKNRYLQNKSDYQTEITKISKYLIKVIKKKYAKNSEKSIW